MKERKSIKQLLMQLDANLSTLKSYRSQDVEEVYATMEWTLHPEEELRYVLELFDGGDEE